MMGFAVPIARSYPITTVQFHVTGGLITCLWLSEGARCTHGGFFEATAGECDEMETTSCQHGMMMTALMKTAVSDLVGKI
jgi:hypothetical protein